MHFLLPSGSSYVCVIHSRYRCHTSFPVAQQCFPLRMKISLFQNYPVHNQHILQELEICLARDSVDHSTTKGYVAWLEVCHLVTVKG